jgi:hypothetical protein
MRRVVIRSVSMAGETRCVDLFREPDGRYGFGEDRRDPEDPRGWYAAGTGDDPRRFAEADAAWTAARAAIPWLAAAE